MADVQGLGHVGPAVVHHDGLALADFLDAKVFCGAHFFQIIRQERPGELQVEKAGHHRFTKVVVAFVQPLRHGPGDLDGGALILLRGSQGTVALVFAQVGPVGNRHPSEGRVIPGSGKGLLHFFRNDI